MTEDVQPLTRAQAAWIKKRAHEIARVVVTADDVYDAIYDLTAKPGEREFCEGCEWWGVGYASGTDKIPIWGCLHWDARDGFCPKEGGDA